ncbi:hypothetical protein MGYG_00211 [Nannizzia gypsea CBS 118893]|uniref:Uncharacterized protein n=1 Tax=Arthroderma gypseum (strain ATCC MYA-4604 / CBS 118893) TaxID=535722 RepID=E5R3P3_ARTGP|nr:hypothetical protein MGYG_00211 [Nannizzia gypsea CBS 118893]EFQ97167.1 hypothetical protein MGYG_00211 [Nannizzia gypsea CBS 118893]
MASQPSRASTESLLLGLPLDNNYTSHVDDEHKIKSINETALNYGYHLPRFYARAFMAMFVPTLVTVYYFVIRNIVLRRENDLIKYGLPGETWLYYSWFIVGVFGLNLSRYALLGIEAAMLQDSFWQVNNAMGLLMHCGASWSGPVGWIMALRGAWIERNQKAYRLWYTLATLSLLASIALPLSGLGFKLSEGYVVLPDPPRVIGRTFDNYAWRAARETYERTLNSWKEGAVTTIPAFGIAYTPPGRVNRGTHPSFNTTPNSIPIDGVIPDIFLAPQAETPIQGRVWGLRIGCNCSIVKSVSELTILNQKLYSTYNERKYPWAKEFAWGYPYLTLKTPTKDVIFAFNSTLGDMDTTNYDTSLFAYTEMGTNSHSTEEEIFISTTNSSASSGVEILEYVVWQAYMYPLAGKDVDFNFSINDPIPGLGHPVMFEPSNGTMPFNKTFLSAIDVNGTRSQYAYYPLSLPDPDDFLEGPDHAVLPPGISPVAAPIGVRCVRNSAFGHANVSADGTYTSFTETANPPKPKLAFGLGPFGSICDMILRGHYLDHFRSTHSSSPVTTSLEAAFANYLQASTLLQSISQAYAVEALQLMYEGATFSSELAFNLANATSTRKDKIIVPGSVPLTLPAVLLILWATGSAVLGIMYGFRRRWSEVLDGYSIFSFGVDCAEEVRARRQNPARPGGGILNQRDALRSIPGLIGDSRMRDEIGHISLVERGNVARKEKLYA